MPAFIGISGGIATGKTTFGTLLARALPNAVFQTEDVSLNPYLADFYLDMRSWAFHSRMAFLAMKALPYRRVDSRSDYIIIDRPVHELSTFARIHHDAGFLSARDFETFVSLHTTLLSLVPPLDHVVHVHCAPETSFERMKKRGRAFEQAVSLEYLQRIPSYYATWLSEGPPDRTLSVNTDDEDLEIAAARIASQIVRDLRRT